MSGGGVMGGDAPTPDRVTVVDGLRDRSRASMDRAEEVREEIVRLEQSLERKRSEMRALVEESIEYRFAANILEDRGLRVTTAEDGTPTVSVNPIRERVG